MEGFVSQLVNAAAIGQVYALIALGFSLIFGVANIINFAQGAMFMLGAFATLSLVQGLRLPLWLGAPLAVLLVALASVLLERVALRPLAGKSAIAPLLSTLAVSIIVEQASEIAWGPDSRPFPNPFVSASFMVGDAFVTGADLLITTLGVGSVVALLLFLKGSWTGRALRVTAQDPDAALQMGVPVDSIRQIAFALSGALGALSGVLVAFYFQSVFPQMGMPFGLKGFSAAVLGGLSSLPGALVGGPLLGLAETMTSAYLGEQYRDMAAYTLLLLVLVVRPAGLLGDRRLEALGGTTGAANAMPTSSLLADTGGARQRVKTRQLGPAGLVAVAAVAALLPLVHPGAYVLHVASVGLVYALLTASLTLASGSIGLLSLAHAVFYGCGAYATALLAKSWGLPAELVLLCSAAVTGAVAAVASLPLLRLSGHTVALGTLALGQIGSLVFLNWIAVTRGPMGIPDIPKAWSLLAGGRVLATPGENYIGILVVVLLGLLLAQRLTSAPLGVVWRAIREDRLAAHAAGIAVGRYIFAAYAASGVLAGLAGGLFAYQYRLVSPESFDVNTSIVVLTMGVLGGLGNVTGAALAGFVLACLPELLRDFDAYRMVVYGLLLLLALRFRPQGLLGTH